MAGSSLAVRGSSERPDVPTGAVDGCDVVGCAVVGAVVSGVVGCAVTGAAGRVV